MNKQTVDAMLGRQGGTVDPKTGSPHMLLWFKSRLSHLQIEWPQKVPVSLGFKVPHKNHAFCCVGIE